jgi:hypothetical protein
MAKRLGRRLIAASTRPWATIQTGIREEVIIDFSSEKSASLDPSPAIADEVSTDPTRIRR